MNFKKYAAVVLAGAMAVSVLSGCGMNKDAIVTRLGNTPVKLGMVNFMARYEQAAMDDLYRTYFGQDVWQQDLYGAGNTMEQETISDVMNNLHDLMTLSEASHMEEYGVSVSEEDMTAISTAVDAFMQANSREALNEMGATKELVTEMLRLFTVKSKMHAAMIEKADTNVSDEEANMRGYTVVSTSLSSRYDSEQGSYVELTEEEVLAVKAEMEALSDEISGDVSLEDAAKEHNFTASYKTYGADDTSMEAALKEALDLLSEGEFSVLTTDSTYYIVRLDKECDEEATESHRESIIASRQEEVYKEQLTAWQKEDGWDANVNAEQLAKISFKNGFTQKTEDTEETEAAGTEAE